MSRKHLAQITLINEETLELKDVVAVTVDGKDLKILIDGHTLYDTAVMIKAGDWIDFRLEGMGGQL